MGTPVSGDVKVKFHRSVEGLGLPEPLVEELTEKMILVRYTEGSTIVASGSPASFLFWLARGLVKVYCPNIDGTRVLVRLAGPGDILGDTEVVNANGARRHLYTIQAVNNCEVALLARDHVIEVLDKLDKGQSIKLIEDLNTRWSETIFWHLRLFGLNFRDRLEMVFADLGRRFGIKDERGILIGPELSHRDLAELIGSSRPMISRLVTAMTDRRELIRSGKQYVITPRATWLTKCCEPLLPELSRSGGLKWDHHRPNTIGYQA